MALSAYESGKSPETKHTNGHAVVTGVVLIGYPYNRDALAPNILNLIKKRLGVTNLLDVSLPQVSGITNLSPEETGKEFLKINQETNNIHHTITSNVDLFMSTLQDNTSLEGSRTTIFSHGEGEKMFAVTLARENDQRFFIIIEDHREEALPLAPDIMATFQQEGFVTSLRVSDANNGVTKHLLEDIDEAFTIPSAELYAQTAGDSIEHVSIPLQTILEQMSKIAKFSATHFAQQQMTEALEQLEHRYVSTATFQELRAIAADLMHAVPNEVITYNPNRRTMETKPQLKEAANNFTSAFLLKHDISSKEQSWEDTLNLLERDYPSLLAAYYTDLLPHLFTMASLIEDSANKGSSEAYTHTAVILAGFGIPLHTLLDFDSINPLPIIKNGILSVPEEHFFMAFEIWGIGTYNVATQEFTQKGLLSSFEVNANEDTLRDMLSELQIDFPRTDKPFNPIHN